MPSKPRLTDRLAAAERIILARPRDGQIEQKIVLQLFGVISYYARPKNERSAGAQRATWLMAEIEEILRRP